MQSVCISIVTRLLISKSYVGDEHILRASSETVGTALIDKHIGGTNRLTPLRRDKVSSLPQPLMYILQYHSLPPGLTPKVKGREAFYIFSSLDNKSRQSLRACLNRPCGDHDFLNRAKRAQHQHLQYTMLTNITSQLSGFSNCFSTYVSPSRPST